MQKTLQDLHISHERNYENIPILVEERGDAFRGIPKLRRLSLLEYLLGVPWASPSLSSCFSSFSSYRDLPDQTLHPHKTSTENLVRSGVPPPQASVATKNQSGPCSGNLPEGGSLTGGHLHHPDALHDEEGVVHPRG